MRRKASVAWLACGALVVHACALPHFGTDPSLDLPSLSEGGQDGGGGTDSQPAGGAADVGDSGAAAGGQGSVPAGVVEGEPCPEDARVACKGAAQPERLVCQGGTWQAAEACDASRNCDQSSGECRAIVERCVDAAPGKLFCVDLDLTECGPDLVTSRVVDSCSDGCVETGNTADCVPKTCGDKSRQPPEQCDDGNRDDTDDCTSACKVAHCGDSAIWKGHEDCDDGNTTTETCAYGLQSCTVCNAACHKQAGVVALCGDGKLQPDDEQCDSEAVATQGTCNEKCEDASWALWNMTGIAPNLGNYSFGTDTVNDKTTGLVWQRVVDPTERTWQEAQDYCWSLTLGNESNWRAPTKVELISLVDYTKTSGAAVNTVAFADAKVGDFWWSSIQSPGGSYGSYLNVGSGSLSIFNMTVKATVRCVH